MARNATEILNRMKKYGYTAPEHVISSDEDSYQEQLEREAERQRMTAQEKYRQYQRENAEMQARQSYALATPAQKSALENIYTAQNAVQTGGDRYSGYTTSDYMANQFKKDNSVDDEAYKNLMAGYKAYRAQQALAAQDSYSGITDEQKKELSQIGKMQNTGGILNGITGRTKQNQQESQNLADQFKKKYGVNDATYSTWQGMNDQEQADKEAAEEASRSGKRTYSQELDYAENMFKTKGKNNSNSLRSDISKYSSMVSEAKMQRSSGLAESASNIQTDFGEQAQKDADSFRESVKKKYGLSDNDIDDLVYYGQELDDYSNRQQQKQEAYNNVHQGSTAKNILGGIKNTATALTLNPYAGIGAIGETAKYYGGGYRDKKSPMNVNSVAFGASNATTDYQSATQEALNNKSKVLGTLYGAGMSTVESAETGTLGGAVDGTGLGARVARSALSLAPFGANAYASSISQNVADKDQSQGKAMANALASASVEVATEIASADKFWDIFKNHNATARKRIIDFLVSSGIEGSEEVVGDIADNFIDAALNEKNSEYNQSVRDYMKQGMSREEAKRQATKDTLADTANSFVTGALSGAMGAGIATASGYANDAYNSKTMFDGYTKEDYAQWAEGLDTDPTHYKNASTAQSAEMAKSLAEKMAQEDNATPRQKRELYEYYQDMQNTEMEAAAESEEKENRKDKIEGIKNKVGSFFGRNEATEGQQAEEQTNTTESTDTQKTAMVEPQNVPEEHRTQSTDIEPNDAYAKMAAAQNGEELRNAYQEAVHSTNEETRERADSDLQIVSGMLQKRGISAEEIESAKISTEDAYAAGYSGQEISEAVPANVKIAYNDGQKQAIEDRARQTLEARDSVKRTAAKQITDGARTIIEANYKDGMNASAYNDVMSSAINAGRTGMSYENYLKKAGSSVSIVGEDLAKKAYAAGLQVSVNDAVKEVARSMSEKTGVKTFGTGTFTDARSDTSEPFNGSSVMQAVARMTGLNVVLTDQNFREGENGYYKSGNSTIYINSERAENAASTLFHEVGEFASVWNQKEYAGVVSDIMKASQNVLGTRTFNNIRQKYVNAYIGEEGKTDADVDKEMANDLIYQFLGNEKGMNKLMDQIDQNHGYKEAKSIKQKLADWVGHMVESIKNFLSDLNPNSYQRKMAEANLQNYEELQDAIVKSIANAEKSYAEAKAQSQQAIESVETDSSRKSKNVDFAGTTISISADGKYGIDEEGRKYPVVDLDYDAVLLDEGSVPNGNGGTKWRGISYTVRDKNQIKNVDNKTPTDDSDIRRDIGIDDYVTDQELWSDHYDTKKSLIEVLRSGNEILKNSDIDKTAVRRIAREIKEQYHSNIDVNELAENLAKVFRYAQGQNYIDYDDLATVISEVASPVIDGSVTKVGAEEFNQFKNALQGVTYNLDSKQEAEVISAFGSWGNFRKAIPGVKFTRDGSGVSLDGVWNTLVQETGYVLDMDTSSNDMPLALVDAYNAMKPEYQNAFGEDATQAAQDAAMEIVARYYQYSAGQEKLKLKAKQKQELLDQARRMAASNAEYRKKIKQEYQKRYEEELSKVRQSGGRSEPVSKQVARLRAKNARTVASIREQQKRKDELRMLRTPVKNLMDMLTGPTDKKHVPALVQTPVLQLASAFDFVPQTVRETADGKFSIRILESRDINADGSYSYKWKTIHADSRADAIAQYKKAMEENGLGSAENKSWQESLRAIQDLYQQDEGDDWFERSELKQGLDKELGEKLGEILRKNQGTISIAQLSSDELKTLNAVVRNVLHSINQMNRMYSQPSQQVSDIAHMAMDRTTSGVKGRREHFKPVASLVNTLTLDHASPETYFHGIFGGENTDPVTKTLIGAQNKKARDVRQASEYMEDVRDKVGVKPKDLESWMKETKNYYGLNLTTTQVMSLYELSKRPDAQQHKAGGFVADEASRKTVSGQRLPVQLTDAQIKAITDTLTPQQKQMADAMQYYLAHQCAEQGNETCMQLYGYEKFVDEHYFPMTTDKNTIATRDSNVTQGAINAIKNSGFTKDITPNASNPLVLRDIFAVYSDHVAQMATYHAWAAPIQDIIRFFNYSEKTDVKVDGQTFTGRNSVKDAIDFFYGKSGQEYFVKLLSSINDREKSSFVGGDFYDLMTGHAKTAAVMGNLRVVIQQPTAIFRAGEMISYKYLNEGMAGKYRKEAAELRDRTSDVFWLKNQGNIDGYITQSLVSTITGVKTTREKINDFAGRAASKADEITWGAMYRAVYAEQVDKLGKEKIGTKEFEDAVNERFSEIVLRTQVYDGIITRSQFMRSPDKANRMMSAFMAEPVKTYNIILRDMIDISQATDEQQVKKAVAHLVRITAPVLLITNAVNAVAQSFADALRSAGDPDDEDKDFLRRFMDALGFGNWLDEDASFSDKAWEFLSGNLVDNMDLLSNIPMVAQYWDATKEGVMSVLGESTYSSDSDLSMSGVKNFFKAVKAIVNPSEKMTTYGKVAALTRAFSDLSGYPLYAAQRDVVAIYNTVASQIFKQLPVLQKTTKYTPKKQAKLDVYTAALESGGDYKKAVEDAVAQGNDYKAISSGISDTYKDTYLALKETNPNEAIKMKNRLVMLYVYLSDKAGTNKDKTTSEKTKYYSDNIDKWK